MRYIILITLVLAVALACRTVQKRSTASLKATAVDTTNWPYAPTSPDSPTVGKGIDLSAELKAAGYPQEIIDSISKDIRGVPRKPGHWDIGAYQYPWAAAPTNVVITNH